MKSELQEENEASFFSVGLPFFCAKASGPLLEEVAEVDEQAWNEAFINIIQQCYRVPTVKKFNSSSLEKYQFYAYVTATYVWLRYLELDLVAACAKVNPL